MQKAVALVVVVLITLGALSGIVGWQVSERYQQTHVQVVDEINHSLNPHNLQLNCTVQNEWLGLVRNELCTLERLSRPLVLLEFWQQVVITPFWLQSRFGVTPDKGFAIDFFNIRSLFEGQMGEWRLAYGRHALNFTYHSGALKNNATPNTEMLITPLQIQGVISIDAPYKSQLQLKLAELKFEQLSQVLHLKNLELQLDSLQKQQARFIERSDLSFGYFEFAAAGSRLTANQFDAKQANMLVDNELASLNDIQFEGLRLYSQDSDTRFNSNKIRFYLDNINWSQVESLSASTKIQQLPSITDLEQLLNGGFRLSLDTLETDVIYHDRSSALLSASGDLSLNGDLRISDRALDPIEQRIEAKLNLNLSDSLMLGPQAGIMMDFIDQGWLYSQGKRLVGRLYFANGKLVANGNLVSSKGLLPSFEEDQ